MKTILVTGAAGFIGTHLVTTLARDSSVRVLTYDSKDSHQVLQSHLRPADVVFHLAGVNRDSAEERFVAVNVGLTDRICDILSETGRSPLIVFSSSIHAGLETPYGQTKRAAECRLEDFALAMSAPVAVYRLSNVFGKWCRPDYNSVVATFCHNIAHGLPIRISDPQSTVELCYIDDVITAFVSEIRSAQPGYRLLDRAIATYAVTLGDLADRIQAFNEMRASLLCPDMSVPFNRALYATYSSYVPGESYALPVRRDARGTLVEFLKSRYSGQIFLSRTRPGVTRGNHYHDTKTEKFLVLEGHAIIRIRRITEPETQEISVRGDEHRVVDIPPGCTHSITNVGDSDLITLFWAGEVFDPGAPDTYGFETAASSPQLLCAVGSKAPA